ncbi:MAG TPA: MYXO-CTERM sorting domain-containing protein [Opitutaceae bacterium]|nr:MYXO-CTERM sorting domain-containing protein [Opitutaceae bacterium]
MPASSSVSKLVSRIIGIAGGFLALFAPARLGAQTAPAASVGESGYTLFFLGVALLALAVYNLRRRRS